MWGQTWWELHQDEKNSVSKEELKPPEKCDFCGVEIKEDDYFNIGYDEHMIYAEVCDHFECKKWLVHKTRSRK